MQCLDYIKGFAFTLLEVCKNNLSQVYHFIQMEIILDDTNKPLT